jgi:hypothetical protein
MSTRLLQGRAASAITINYTRDKSAYVTQVLVVPNIVKVTNQIAHMLEHPEAVSYLPDACAAVELESSSSVRQSASVSYGEGDVDGLSALVAEGKDVPQLSRQASLDLSAGTARDALKEDFDRRVAVNEYHLCWLCPLSEKFAPDQLMNAYAYEAQARVAEGAEALHAKQRKVCEALCARAKLAQQKSRGAGPGMLNSKAVVNILEPTIEGDVDLSEHEPIVGSRYRELKFHFSSTLSGDAVQFANGLRFLSSYMTMCVYANRHMEEAIVITVSNILFSLLLPVTNANMPL